MPALDDRLAALRRIALAVAQPGGSDPFGMLVDELAGALGCGAVFIAVAADAPAGNLRTLAVRLDERRLRNFEYPVRGSPCEQVVGHDFRYVARGVAAEFPAGTLFAAQGMDSYAAYPLHDGSGAPLGLLAALDRQPVAGGDAAHAEAMLKIVAVRAAAELERSAAGAALRRSEASYRAIFDAAEDSIFIHDWDSGAILDVNPKACETYGWAREEWPGLSVADISANEPPFTAEEAARWLALARGGACPPFEWRRRHKDGSLHWDEVRLKPATIAGRPHLLAFTRDITERKAALEALASREEQYRAIFEAASDGFLLWDANERVVDANPALLRLYGYTREQVVGHGYAAHLPADYVAERLSFVRRALAGETVAVETIALRPDGSRFEIDLRVMPFRHRGQPHALAIVRDISARREHEAQLRQAQKMEAIGQLTGGIAHDFNNILTSVIGWLVMGQERAEAAGDATLARQLGQAQQAAQRGRDLIGQMLAFARRRQGARRVLALAPLLRQALPLLAATLPGSIELDAAGLGDGADSPSVEADAVQLEQVLLNLCLNARDALPGHGHIRLGLGTHDGGGHCRSCGRRLAPGRWVELHVEDDGSGIAPEVMQHIFEPFYSTKEVGRGSGMGLAMVHGIVHDHGGHLLVDSTPGRGACFRVLLPPAAAGRAADAAPPAPVPAAALPRRLAGRVLLVEDDPQAGDYLAELLSGWGLTVVLRRDPLQALDWLRSTSAPAQLLLTDHRMPHMTGLELAGAARVLQPGLPVLLVSAQAAGFDAATLAAHGVQAALAKPVDGAQLRALLHGLITTPG